MFPRGSVDDCSIVSIFQYLSDIIDHVGICPDVIFDGLNIRVATRSIGGYRVDIPRLVRRT
jgi:hypothetical protein